MYKYPLQRQIPSDFIGNTKVSASLECDKWWMRLKVAQECTPNMSLEKCAIYIHAQITVRVHFRDQLLWTLLILLLFGGLFVWPIHSKCLAFHLLIWMTPQSGYFGDLNQFLTEKHFWCCLLKNEKGFIFRTFSRNIFVVKYKIDV